MKKLILILLCLPIIGFSQQQNKIYFDSDFKACAKSKAEYFRLTSVNLHGNIIGDFKDYYISGELQNKGQFSSYNNSTHEMISEGLTTWYHKNGNKSAEAIYSNDKIIGIRTAWYETGELYSHHEYSDNGEGLSYKYYYKSGSLYSMQIIGEKFFTRCDEYGECEKVFEENFKNNSNDWYLGSDDNMVRKIRDEQFYFYNKDDGSYKTVLSFPFDVSNDFSIETTLNLKHQKDYGAGLIWGAKDWDNYYCFKITANGYYKISAKSKGIERVFGVDWTKSELINTGYASNRLKILKEEDKYLFVINGSVVYSEEFYKIRSSNIGFIFPPGEGAFDNLIIKYEIASNEIISKNRPSGGRKTGSGTGFAISSNGYIATNYHVIEGANDIKVKGINGDLHQSYPAQVIVSDKNNDLAILKIDKWIGTIPYGMKLDKLGVAEEVYAYGYPLTALLGDEIKFTDGRISSGTGMGNDPRYYQHTASLQPGNSGGPLFNKYGNIVGINTLTVSKKFDDQTGIDTENIFYSIKTSYLTILMDNLGISKPSNKEIYNYTVPKQYKKIKSFIYTVETY
jgi:S1-C subfamily serine protease